MHRCGIVSVMTQKPKATTLRLDADLRARVEAYAERTRRSLNGAVNRLIEQALERVESEKK